MKLQKTPYGDHYGRDYQCVFGGLNENLAARDGEIVSMENMTSDHYPLLSPRAKRYLTRTLAEPRGLAAGDALCWVDGTDFYYGGEIRGQVSAGDKQFYFLNKYVVIWPDKLFYNTATEEFGALEASVTEDDAVRKAIFFSAASPGGISSERNALRLEGITVEGVFRPGDAVRISGCVTHPENNLTLVVREAVGTALYFYDNSFRLDESYVCTVPAEGLAAGLYNIAIDGLYYFFSCPALSEGDTIVVREDWSVTITCGGVETETTIDRGAFGTAWPEFEQRFGDYAEPGPITVAREVPDLDYLCECDNRLWGVKDQTVWCSCLGDPRIWYNFDGTATSAWSVEVGSGGAFTGAYAYGGYPLLFKEDHIYRVYGTKPSNFQLMDTETLGCEAGSDRSFAVVGQTLYYKSRAGFVAYGGGVPSIVDAALGVTRRRNAVGGTDGRKYYVSVEDDGGHALYVYDTVLRLWHREDAAEAVALAWCGGELYMLAADGGLWQIGRVRSAGGAAEDDVESAVEFADFYDGTVQRRAIARLYFRVQASGTLRLSVSYDGGPWQEVGSVENAPRGLQTMYLVPRRCDRFRVRLEGTGDWKLWAMSREYSAGSTRG